jgi:hypothetical protein
MSGEWVGGHRVGGLRQIVADLRAELLKGGRKTVLYKYSYPVATLLDSPSGLNPIRLELIGGRLHVRAFGDTFNVPLDSIGEAAKQILRGTGTVSDMIYGVAPRLDIHG